MKMNVNDLMNLVKDLTVKEKHDIVEQILAMMGTVSGEVDRKTSCGEMVDGQLDGRPNCPHCHARSQLGYIVKRGMKNGTQRYYCKLCGRFFVATTNTAFERSRKDADTWRKFIRYTIEGKSLSDCAADCGIAYQTAFTWRHKVLNVFKVQQKTVKMTGNIQMDEMFIPISFKGNHMKGPFNSKRTRARAENNNLSRKSYHRGTDNKSRSSKDKACVLCMVADKGRVYYGAVPGVGYMQENMLNATVGKNVDKEKSKMLVDQYAVTAKYLLDNKYSFRMMASNTSDNPKDHKPEIDGDEHLQHVNAVHQQLRKFLKPYCGVSSKYLENYVSLFMWQKNIKAAKRSKQIQSVTMKRAATSDCYIPWKTLAAYPAIPQCA